MIRKLTALVLMSISVQACQSAVVIPKNDGSFEIRSQASTSQYALRSALEGASDKCEEQGRSYVVDKQAVLYKGALDEGSKNLINQMSNVAATAAFFSSEGNNAMMVPNNPASSSEDYEAILTIRCQ